MGETDRKVVKNENSFLLKCNQCGEETFITNDSFKGEVDIDFPYSDRAEVFLYCYKCKNKIEIKA